MSQIKELTRCPQCNRVLVSHGEIHAVNGHLYCSKTCAIDHMTEEYIMNAKDLAREAYASEAEVVSSVDVLKEDLQAVDIIVTCSKRVWLPANLSKAKAVAEAKLLHDEGLVIVEPDDCEEIEVEYKLVEEDNSLQED